MGIQNIIILIISLLTILLGFLILRKNYKNPSNVWYFLMCFFGGSWGVMKAIELSLMNVYWHDLVFRFVMLFGTLAPLAYFMLAYHFVYKIRGLPKILLYFIFLIGLILSVLNLARTLRHVEATIIDGVLYSDFLIFAVYFFIYIFLGLIILFKKYSASEGVSKGQIRYLMVGTTLTFLTTGIVSVIFLLFNNFTYDWLGAIFLSIHLLVIGYFIFIKPRIISRI